MRCAKNNGDDLPAATTLARLNVASSFIGRALFLVLGNLAALSKN